VLPKRNFGVVNTRLTATFEHVADTAIYVAASAEDEDTVEGIIGKVETVRHVILEKINVCGGTSSSIYETRFSDVYRASC